MFDDLEPSAPRDDGVEQVYVELDWYDGPRLGLADVGGHPHYFQAVNGYNVGDASDALYEVWPASSVALELEQRQWRVFVEWNTRFERGDAPLAAHPGHGGIDEQYDRTERELARFRVVPADSRVLRASWISGSRLDGARYHADGVSYGVRWSAADRAR